MKDFKEKIWMLKNYLQKFFKNFGRLFMLGFFILIFLFLIFYFLKQENKNQKLKVIFFDVGQGDSIFLNYKNQNTFLIDAGNNNISFQKLSKNINQDLDHAILTHPDSDHITGFVNIFKKFRVKNILVNGDENKNNDLLEEIKKQIENEIQNQDSQKRIANCGDKIIFDDNLEKEIVNKNDELIFYILNPIKNDLVINESNDNSIIIFLVYKNFSFLFLGDASADIEKKIFFNIEKCFDEDDKNLLKEKIKNITILKVSHHGSKTGSNEEFLKKIHPKYSIISAGKNNRFGHPHKEVLERLKRYTENILSTAESGDITFEIDGENLSVKKEK